MARWIALLLLFMMIAAVIYNGEPLEVEQRLHGKVVLALADEDLSEVRVQMDGRKVSLSGPEELLPAAMVVINELSGVQSIETQIIESPAKVLVDSRADSRINTLTSFESDYKSVEIETAQTNTEPFVQITHPEGLYWPTKKEDPVDLESELLVIKVQQNVEVNGTVPNPEIKWGILDIIEQFIEIPEHLYDVTVNKIKETPAWYLQDLPLIIPFVQWVDEGKLQYHGNKILLDGTVLNKRARQAIETAIANIPSQFLIENRLQIGK